MKFKFILFFAVLFFCGGAFAQDIISAKVDKTVAEVNDEILLTVTVSGISADVLSPQLPSLPNFNIYEAGYSASSSFDGRVYVVNTIYLWRLIPRFAGRAEIGPVKIKYLDKEYATQSIYIDVYRKGESAGKPAPQQNAAAPATPAAAAQPRPVVPVSPAQPAKDRELDPAQTYDPVFVLAYTDKREAYVGEQITLNTSFYSSLSIAQGPYMEPQTFDGLVKEDIDQTQENTVLGRKTYGHTLNRKALFGVKEGAAKVGALMLDMVVLKDGWFGPSPERLSVKSVPIDIKIKPLPPGAGDYFYGAVGDKFSINADVDAKTVEAGSAVTLTVTVRGVGNLKTITQPVVPEIKGMKMYDVAGTTNSAAVNGVVQGYKTFKTVLVPAAQGNYTIPPVQFTYFSPAAGQYRTIKTDAINITATPSKNNGAGNMVSYGGAGSGPSARNIAGDINYIKQNAGRTRFNLPAFFAGLGFVNIIPFALLFAAALFRLLDKRGVFARAAAKAKNKAKAAQNAQELNAALFEFIERKTGAPVGSLKINELAEMLVKEYKVSRAAVTDLEALAARLDAFRFAPQGFVNALESAKLKQNVLRIIRALEREIK